MYSRGRDYVLGAIDESIAEEARQNGNYPRAQVYYNTAASLFGNAGSIDRQEIARRGAELAQSREDAINNSASSGSGAYRPRRGGGSGDACCVIM